MARYRKKPVAVEATQWHKNGDHPLDYSEEYHGLRDGEPVVISPDDRREKGWEGDIVRYFRDTDTPGETQCTYCGVRMNEHGWIDHRWIDTLGGGHIVCPGDYIITGVQGEHYPCKPDIFEATYDAVGDGDLNDD